MKDSRRWLIPLGVSLLAGAPLMGCGPKGTSDRSELRIDFFAATMPWGDSPHSTGFYWRFTNPSGKPVQCIIDVDDVTQSVVDDCDSSHAFEWTFTEPGAYRVRLTVRNEQHEASQEVEVFSNYIQFKDNVVFPEQNADFVSAEIEADSVRLLYANPTTAPSITAGQILWGTSAGGYLRRVTGVFYSTSTSGRRYQLQTVPIKLEEAVVSAKFGIVNQKLAFTDITCDASCDSIEQIRRYQPDEPGPKGGATLSFEVDFGEFPVGSYGKLTPSLSVEVEITRAVLDVEDGALREFTLEVKPSVSVAAELGLDQKNAKIDKEWPLSGPIIMGTVPIGPILLVPKLTPKFFLEIDLNPKLSISASIGAEVTAGLQYLAGSDVTAWGSIQPIHGIGEPEAEIGLGSVKLGFAPGFAISIMGIAGPFVEPRAYVKGSLAVKLAEVEACFSASFGADVKFGAELDLFVTRIAAEKTVGLAEFKFAEKCFGPSTAECGDGTCDVGTEDCVSCPGDCGACPAACGNGVIDAGETCDPPATCPSFCSDGKACTRDVLTGSPTSCDATCTFPPITTCVHGDGCCPGGCSAANDDDCGGSASCPNGSCEAGESCSSCPEDCCPSDCGDGVCQPYEDCQSCPEDCICSTDFCEGFDGYFCGDTAQFVGGVLGTLYHCDLGTTTSSVACPNGCVEATSGTPDYCAAPVCLGYGDICVDNAECCSGHCGMDGACCVGAGEVEPGGSCGSPSNCCSGRCMSYVCCWNETPPGCMI